MNKKLQKKRLAWFSSPHPEDGFSKSAYLTSILLPKLSDLLDIELFSYKSGIELGGFASKNFLTANILNNINKFNYYIYNFENKDFCNFIRIHLGLAPGLTWFHDFNLLNDGPEPILNSPWSRVVDLYNNPEQSSLWPSSSDQFIPFKPAAIRESGISFFSVFSNERDLAQFSSVRANKINQEDSGVFLPLPIAEETFSIRNNDLNKENILAICSKPTADTHIQSLLMALKSLPDIKLCWLVERKERIKCEALLSEFDIKNYELIEGRTIETWIHLLDRSKYTASLLYSFYDQLQPWLGISLAKGLYSLVLNFGESEYIPDDVVVKIDCGINEHLQISKVLYELSKTENLFNYNAVDYAKEKFNLSSIAHEFCNYLDKINNRYDFMNNKWAGLCNIGKSEVLNLSTSSIPEAQKNYFFHIYKNLGWL